MLSQFIAGGIRHSLCDSTKRGLLEACTWFPQEFAPNVFAFVDFALYPFAVVNYSHGCDYMLSPMVSPSDH